MPCRYRSAAWKIRNFLRRHSSIGPTKDINGFVWKMWRSTYLPRRDQTEGTRLTGADASGRNANGLEIDGIP